MLTELRTVFIALGLLVLAACAPRQPAEVIERTIITQAQKDEKIGGQFIRIVQSGDTLYSIAFVLGLDVNEIAAWNGIEDTSKLQTGMRIRLTEPLGFRYPVDVSSNKPRAKSSSVNKPVLPKPRITAPVRSVKAKPQVRQAASVKPPNLKSRVGDNRKAEPSTARVVTNWLWPLRGTLIGRFNLSKGQQGIDIQGQRGQSVKASASGEVVYAGDSLKGYGNLIIIKHTANYLSAYAHNQVITVREGQQITQGQEIAKLGYNLKGVAASQFQIRKNGNPVDPMSYLIQL